MRVCEFAKSTGKPCEDGFSKKVLCEKDNVVRCLKECRQICAMYQAKAEPVVVPKKPVQYSAFGVQTHSTTYGGGGCGAPCGGTK